MPIQVFDTDFDIENDKYAVSYVIISLIQIAGVMALIVTFILFMLVSQDFYQYIRNIAILLFLTNIYEFIIGKKAEALNNTLGIMILLFVIFSKILLSIV